MIYVVNSDSSMQVLLWLALTACLVPIRVGALRRVLGSDRHADRGGGDGLDEESSLRDGGRKLWGIFGSRQGQAAAELPKAADHLVKNLPGLNEEITSYAGLLPGDEKTGGKIFYWMVECSKNPESAPVMIWLNGGPGCSSMDGLFLELGPFRIDGDSVHINPHSWHNVANVIFVDQPVGTGFSYTRSKTGYARSDAMVNEHFYSFLLNFFGVHSKYMVNTKTTRPIFFAGESHAGHYIPNMVSHILAKNREATSTMIFDVHGAALGDPWMDPKNQYDATELAHSLALISNGQKNYLLDQRSKCQMMLRTGKLSQSICYKLLDDVIDASTVKGMPKVLMYDARKYVHSTNEFPPGKREVERYMNKPEVKRAIHADESPQRFVECADPPFDALAHQDGKGAMAELATVLNAGVRVLVYSGQYDLICNHIGTETALNELNWEGQEQWANTKPGVWLVGQKPAGYARSYRNLQSVVIMNSGHMVPMDQPVISLEMVKRFISGHDLSSEHSRIPVKKSEPAPACEERAEPANPRSLDVPSRETDLLSGLSDNTMLAFSSPFAVVVLLCFGVTFLILFWRASRLRNGTNMKRKDRDVAV